MTGQDARGERRVVTALFVDVVGSSSLAAEMDPEDWTDVVSRALAVMGPCVDRYSGSIVQFAGDSILALFGAPTAHEDDPYRAVRAALDILDAVEDLSRQVEPELGSEVRVRAGINTGLVVTSDLTAGDLNVYTALGDAANVAARVQDLAKPGSLVVADATYRLVSNDVDVEALGPTKLKGKAEPIAVYRVTGVRETDSRTRGIPGLTSPMVGRDDELASLLGLVDAANAGRGSVAAIIGEPGVGKSRLLAELRGRIAAMEGARLVLGRCASYDERRPYHLIASLLRAIGGATDSEDLETVGATFRRTVEPILDDSSPNMDRLLQLLGVVVGHEDDKAEVLHESYSAALGDLFSRLAEEHEPLVLACEDIHWSDASSAELLVDALRGNPHAPMLVVVLSRPDRSSHGWSIVEGVRRDRGEALVEVQLGPLGGDEGRELVANLLEIESLPERVGDAVLDRAEGNPFFLEEIVRMLIERGLIERDDDRWVARAEIEGLEVPETLQGLLAARIDMLSGPAHTTANVASVIGRRFEARILDGVLAVTHGRNGGSEGSSHVAELEANGFLRLAATQPQLEFVFRHALIHEVVYGSILKRERRGLHRHVAEAIESHHEGELDELAPVLARHYSEARVSDRAVPYLMTAGRLALERHARQEALDFFTQASAQLESMEDAPPRVRVEATLGRVEAGDTFVTGPESIAMLDGALEAAERVGDPDLTGRLHLERLHVWEMMGQLHEHRDVVEHLRALLPEVEDRSVRGRLKSMMAWDKRVADDFRSAELLFSEAVLDLEAADRPSDAAIGAALLADVLSTVGNFEEAEEWIARSSELAERSGDPNAIADASLIEGKIASDRGDLEEALEHTKRGVKAAEDAGNVFSTLAGNFLAGDQELRRGHADAAVSHLEKSAELAAFCRAGSFEMLGAAWLATARARLGDLEPSRFDEPLEQAQAAGRKMEEGLVLLQRGIALSGDEVLLPAALDDLATAVDLFEQIGARPLHARALHAHGLALEVAGDEEEARAHLEAAAALFDQLGIAPDSGSRPDRR